jgi:hypothetical protein
VSSGFVAEQVTAGPVRHPGLCFQVNHPDLKFDWRVVGMANGVLTQTAANSSFIFLSTLDGFHLRAGDQGMDGDNLTRVIIFRRVHQDKIGDYDEK